VKLTKRSQELEVVHVLTFVQNTLMLSSAHTPIMCLKNLIIVYLLNLILSSYHIALSTTASTVECCYGDLLDYGHCITGDYCVEMVYSR